jgi:hypothetical protein
MKRKLTGKELDALTRSLFRDGAPNLEGGESPDAVFLAGFRRKLEEARGVADAASIGLWCWKAAPILAIAIVVMALSLHFMTDDWELTTDSREEVLWAWTENGSTALSGELLLDAILLPD